MLKVVFEAKRRIQSQARNKKTRNKEMEKSESKINQSVSKSATENVSTEKFLQGLVDEQMKQSFLMLIKSMIKEQLLEQNSTVQHGEA